MDTKLVAKLRQETGVGFGLCAKALKENKGDYDKALAYVNKHSKEKSEKRGAKDTGNGIIDVYSHGEAKNIGVMIELRCETDFVSRSKDFRDLAHELSLQVAAMSPLYINKDDVPEDEIKKITEEVKKSKDVKEKPDEIVEKIVTGRLNKFYKEKCLMEQIYFRQDSKTVGQFFDEGRGKLGENIKLIRFVRWQI